ncbi:MAG: DMT family transporter [Syntrophorhabdaceae bacterium]|nr:DMT family transporter [Syntrophorhabdaceae bacterium]
MIYKNQTKAYTYASFTVLFWSTVATAFKIALKEMNNIQVLLVANTTSLLVFGITLILQKKLSKLKDSGFYGLGRSALQGFLNPFLYYLVVFKAYSLLPAQVAQPANFVWPIVLMVLSAPILKQPLKAKGLMALFISFSGVMILSSQGKLSSFKVVEPLGVGLALFSSVIWSFFWLLNLKDNRDDLVKLFLSSFFSNIYIYLFALIRGDLFPILSLPLVPAIYIGLFEMGVTYILWLKALRLSETTGKVSGFIYLTPFISLIFISLVLKEELYYTSFIGLCLIVGGVIIGEMRKGVFSH